MRAWVSVQSHPGSIWWQTFARMGTLFLCLLPAGAPGHSQEDADPSCGCLHAVVQVSHLGGLTPGGPELLLHCHSPGDELLLLVAALICSSALASRAAQLDSLLALTKICLCESSSHVQQSSSKAGATGELPSVSGALLAAGGSLVHHC